MMARKHSITNAVTKLKESYYTLYIVCKDSNGAIESISDSCPSYSVLKEKRHVYKLESRPQVSGGLSVTILPL